MNGMAAIARTIVRIIERLIRTARSCGAQLPLLHHVDAGNGRFSDGRAQAGTAAQNEVFHRLQHRSQRTEDPGGLERFYTMNECLQS
jgi:hypothetical protein